MGPMLLSMTNRKLRTRFRLVPKSTTVLGWPWRVIMHSVSKHMRLSEPTMKIWIKIEPYYQRRRYSPMTLVSGSSPIRFMRIFPRVLWRGGVKRQWGNRKRGFSGFRTLRLRHFRKWGEHYYILVLFLPCRLSSDSTIHDLEWPFYVKFSLLQTAASAIRLHTYRKAYL